MNDHKPNKSNAEIREEFERRCADRAVKIVSDNGGKVTFDAYDSEYLKIIYAPTPFHWAIEGSGLGRDRHKINQGILCARKAVALGLLKKDNEKGMYLLP